MGASLQTFVGAKPIASQIRPVTFLVLNLSFAKPARNVFGAKPVLGLLLIGRGQSIHGADLNQVPRSESATLRLNLKNSNK